MFQLLEHLPVAYENPWNASFEQRLADLTKGRLRIAYFYETPDTSTFRYRVFNMVETLNANPDVGVSASWFSLADATRIRRFVDQADVIVLCRARYGPIVDSILSRAQARKIPVIFDVDDLVFDQAYVSLILDTLNQDHNSERAWDYWFAYVGRMGATLRDCDHAITTNEYLAEKISDFVPDITCTVVPNFLNRIQQERSLAVWDAKSRSDFKRDRLLHIGYFSGTPTHNNDFAIAAPALASLMDRVPSAILRVVGYLDVSGHLASYKKQIEVLPLQDFLNLQRLIGEVELNLVPLQNNAFTNCKSELKYFEAAIVGTLTMATPTATYRNAIDDGKSGLLCNAHEWESKLSSAIDIIENLDSYRAIAKCAHESVVKRYRWDGFAGQIKSAVVGL